MRRRGLPLALVLVALVMLVRPVWAAIPIDRPTDAQWAQILASTGRWTDLQTALQVMFAESSGNPMARNPNGARGPWQFTPNTLADDDCAIDPVCSTAAAFRVSSGGTNWSKWEAYTSGAYASKVSRAVAAIAAAGQSSATEGVPSVPALPRSQLGQAPDSNKGMGIDGLVPRPPIQHGNEPFLYERYAPLDYPPLHIDSTMLAQGALGALLGFDDPTQLAMNVSLNAAAGLGTDLLVLIGVLATRLLAWSLRVDLLAGADGPLNAVVSGLAQGFYQPLVPFLLTLVLGWLIWTWLIRRRTMRGFTGAGWMFAALTLGAIYFAAPSQILDNASAFTAAISRVILGAVGGADTTVHRGDPTVAQGPVDDAELRLFADRFWNVYVYQPWTLAEFGRLDPKDSSGQPLGVMLLEKHAGHPNQFDDGLNHQPQEVRDWYNGAKGGDRLIVVGVAVLVAAVACVVFLAAAIVRLAATVVFLALLMALPVILLIALHPTIGRKLLLRWLELAAGALWRQVVYSLFLAVMVVLVGVVSAAASVGGWGLVALCQLAATAGLLIFRKPLLAIFGQIPGRGTRIEHVGSSRTAEAVHQSLGTARQRLPIPAFASGRTPSEVGKQAAKKTAASGAGMAATAGKAAGGWVTLVGATAVKGGQIAVRKGEEAKRGLQGAAGAFVVEGKGGRPAPRRMPEKPLGATASALTSHAWALRHRRPQFANQKALPADIPPSRPAPKQSKGASPRWIRQPGGGHLLMPGKEPSQ